MGSSEIYISLASQNLLSIQSKLIGNPFPCEIYTWHEDWPIWLRAYGDGQGKQRAVGFGNIQTKGLWVPQIGMGKSKSTYFSTSGFWGSSFLLYTINTFCSYQKKKGGKCSLSILNFFKCLSPRGYFPSPPGQRATSAPDSQGSGKAWFSNTSPTQLSQLLPQAQDMTCWVQWSLWRTAGQEVEEYSDQILLRWPQRGNLPYYSPISSAGKIARFYDLSSVSIITAT